MVQWVQDFPEGCQPPDGRGVGNNLMLGQIFGENCMKMKEIGPRREKEGTGP